MIYKLLALDLDGTILSQDITIQPKVIDAIAAARAQGAHVTLATGRMFGATVPFINQLHIQDPVICHQGALIQHPISGEIITQVLLPGDLAAEAVNTLLADDVFVIAFINEQLYIAAERPELEIYLHYHSEGTEVFVTPNLAAVVAAEAPIKLLIVAQPPVVGHELKRLEDQFRGRLSVVRSHAIFGELTALGVSKGAALATLAKRLGIAREQVIAIGDHENDLPMIAWAGLGLAMGNATTSVRAAADAVIPPIDEAGVAWAIERYLLSA